MGIGAACLALALVFGACSPVISPQPGTMSPPQSPAPASPASATPPSSTEQTEAPDPTAQIAADCGQVITATAPQSSPKRALAAYSTTKGLFVYNVTNNATAHLDSSTSPDGLRPRFRAPSLVSFARLRVTPDDEHTFGQDLLVEFDIGAETAIEILRFPNSILAYDWNADGTVLAYLLRTQTPTLIGPHLLCSFDSRTGETSLLRLIERPFGTSVGQREETAVSWAPNGLLILVTDTAARPSVFVVTADGHDATPPRNGTFGRWLSDDQLMFQEDSQDATVPWEWLLMSSATGATRPFGFPSAAFRPAISPSGNLIAFDDGDRDGPAVHIFDTEARTARRIIVGYVAPIWIGPNTIAVTEVGPCTSGEFCDIPWSTSGSTVAINTETGTRQDLALPTTLAEGIRYGPIDVLLP